MRKFSVMAVLALAMVSVSGVFANGGNNDVNVNNSVQNDTVETQAPATCDSVACDSAVVAK